MFLTEPYKKVLAHTSTFLRDVHADESVSPELKARAAKLGEMVELAGHRIINLEQPSRDRYL